MLMIAAIGSYSEPFFVAGIVGFDEMFPVVCSALAILRGAPHRRPRGNRTRCRSQEEQLP
jgi:hypothetical protein